MVEQGRPSKRVLIIDDDAAFVQALQARLAKEGLDVRACSYGEQGIADARVFLPDLVILDVLMPGVHGIHVLSELRRIPVLDKTQIIVISGVLDRENEERVLRLRAEFVSKSGDAQGIVAKAKRCLGVL
ncbi:MAG: response regulator [Elusimicrobia bacterium]|nr:response regulator [Elusimicrobiota bacterium]